MESICLHCGDEKTKDHKGFGFCKITKDEAELESVLQVAQILEGHSEIERDRIAARAIKIVREAAFN